MPLSLVYPANSLTGGYEVANSCRFTRGDSPYMHITPGSDGDLRKFTVAFWCKRGLLTTGSGTGRQVIFSTATNDAITFDGSTDKLVILEDGGNALVTERLFRDCSAWYHVCVAVDTEQGVAANRIKLYINGTLITDFSTTCQTSQNADMGFGKASEMMSVGRSEFDDNRHFDGYLAEFYYINDAQLAASDFGEFDEDSPSIFKPKEFEGSFGTNGFYLDFEDSANLGNDANGGTDLTEVNLAAADQATDTPTNSFATLNPLYKTPNSLNFSEGNCQIQGASGNGGRFAGGTFCPDAGKWYMEIKVTVSGSYPIMGIIDSSSDIRENSAYFVAADSGTNQSGFAIFSNDDVYHNNDNTFDQWQTYATNDIIGLALDMDASTPTITFLKNNGSSEAFTTEAPNSGHYIFPAIGNYMQAAIAYCNFGGCSSFALTSAESDANGYGNFEYAPPSGYLAMCSKNIGENS